MTYTSDSISGTHAEFMDWVNWFLREQVKRGMSEPDKNGLGAAIFAFLESGASYMKRGKPCVECGGKGHNNLILLGSKEPAKCSTCGGSGYDQS